MTGIAFVAALAALALRAPRRDHVPRALALVDPRALPTREEIRVARAQALLAGGIWPLTG